MPRTNPDTPPLRGRILLCLTLMLAVIAPPAFPEAPPPALAASGPAPVKARIAIILDDLGYGRIAGERAVALEGAITLAILPFSPHARSLAASADAAGKEYLVHVPMEPRDQVPWETGGLSMALSQLEFTQALNRMIDLLPGAAGINNHMGSKLTENRLAMDWIMDELKMHQLFFVDSRTTAASVALSAALAKGIPSLQRDIFLDHDPEPEAIQLQLARLQTLARQQGQAVAIGHPRPSTLDALEAFLPTLEQADVELVFVSRLLPAVTTGAVNAP